MFDPILDQFSDRPQTTPRPGVAEGRAGWAFIPRGDLFRLVRGGGE